MYRPFYFFQVNQSQENPYIVAPIGISIDNLLCLFLHVNCFTVINFGYVTMTEKEHQEEDNVMMDEGNL